MNKRTRIEKHDSFVKSMLEITKGMRYDKAIKVISTIMDYGEEISKETEKMKAQYLQGRSFLPSIEQQLEDIAYYAAVNKVNPPSIQEIRSQNMGREYPSQEKEGNYFINAISKVLARVGGRILNYLVEISKRTDNKDIQKNMINFLRNVDNAALLKSLTCVSSENFEKNFEKFSSVVLYDEIKNKLKKDGIVLIIGSHEYGKTYTATRLFCEFLSKGFEPRWIKGGEGSERYAFRQVFRNISTKSDVKFICHLEDPFGKTKYEQKIDLKRDICDIIDISRKKSNIFLILTSRETAFREFEEKELENNFIRKFFFERNVNVRKLSQSYEKGINILEMWAEKEYFSEIEENPLRCSILSHPTHDIARGIAEIIIHNMDDLPGNVRNELLSKISEEDEIAESVAWALVDNYENLPLGLKNDLLLEFTGKGTLMDNY